jgi:Protein of unknown function (DUF402)
MPWRQGETILVRHVHHGRVVQAAPARIVADRPDLVVTWVAPGTPIVYPNGQDGAGRLLPLAHWKIEHRQWFGSGALDLTPPGRAHAIRLLRDDGGSFQGWYVNLQEPLRRRPGGFDTRDLQLDLVVEPDGSVAWKDEDHLEQAVELGLMSADDARLARGEAERVLAEWPFPTGWEDWHPDPGWELPELPAGWDVVER